MSEGISPRYACRLGWRVALLTVIGTSLVAAQDLQIGIIDFYGLARVSERAAREALTFKEGDTIVRAGKDRPAIFDESEKRLSLLPGVTSARVQSICCDQGRAIVYIGVVERGAPAMTFRAAPLGDARLPADIVRAGVELANATSQAAQRGDAGEDVSAGHSLAHDATMRAIQMRLISYARRDLNQLRHVLRTSSDAVHRALAAEVLAYATEKQVVVEDLVYAMSDPSVEVRNNAMRALEIFAQMTPTSGRAIPQIPHQPFMAFLNSPVWSDRNKAAAALATLSTKRDPELLTRLRKESVVALAEMARWKSDGHAIFAFTILGRIAGYSDDAAMAAWLRSERESIIRAALGHEDTKK